ncbi:hypothetical protein HUT06_05340 [Actinomadura sp. NAK00032]|uniref:hypothetical protein n=1 Tax=Actinomadura sp. NAK00032 TaxID=2742128 RepID=UPI0015910987|nr:hypothetical protein [Actinomadura sp. NAK00032]QKW33525.1 hypothetical protein HUT06_05340 [Actinomadura sp. NAK00032]
MGGMYGPGDLLLSALMLIMRGAMEAFQMLMSWWIGGSYNQNFADEKGAGGVLYFLRTHTNWLATLMAFAGFIMAALRAAIQRKGEPFRAAFSNFFELAIIVLMLATVVQLASIAGDKYSTWILTQSAPKDSNWANQWVSEMNAFQATGSMLLFGIFGFFVLISSIIQWGLMLFRSAAMVVLVGLLPVLAASRFTSYGEYAYKRALGWLVSWWAYGPVAATGAAAGQQLMQSDYKADQYAGMAFIVGMVFALPAVFSAIMPAVRDDNNFFSPRQVGHFMFGGTAVNAGKRNGIWSGMTDYINNRRANPGGAATAPGGRLAGVGATRGGAPGGGATVGGTSGGGTPGGGTSGGRGPVGGTSGGGTTVGGTSGGGTSGGGATGGGTPGGGTPGGGTPGTGRRASPGVAASGATSSPAPSSGAVLGGGTGHVPGSTPPGGLNGGANGQRGGAGVGGPQVGGPSGAEPASGGTSGLSLPQSVPPYERDSYESTPKFDSDFQRPSLAAAINEYKHPSGGAIASGGDQYKQEVPSLRSALNQVRGPSGAS